MPWEKKKGSTLWENPLNNDNIQVLQQQSGGGAGHQEDEPTGPLHDGRGQEGPCRGQGVGG